MSTATLQIGVSCTGVYSEPTDRSPVGTEALFGEEVRLRSSRGEWSEVSAEVDGYAGYVLTSALVETTPVTHRVNVPAAQTYRIANFRHPFVGKALYFNSLVQVDDTLEAPEGHMSRIPDVGWVFSDQLVRLGEESGDHVKETLKLTGTMYAWGMRSSRFDCSALIQAGCLAAGVPCSRDVKDQVRELGRAIPIDLSSLRRGDFAFWTEDKGSHVVLMTSPDRCFNMSIVRPRIARSEPLWVVARDQERDGNGPITMVRRL